MAYVGLADGYVVANTYDVLPPTEAYPLARAAVEKSLELDDSLAEAYIARAAISEDYDWNWPPAEQNYRQGIDLKPNYAQAYQW